MYNSIIVSFVIRIIRITQCQLFQERYVMFEKEIILFLFHLT